MFVLLKPEGLMPEGRSELKLSLQPVVERPPFRLALVLPNEIGAHRDFFFSSCRTSVGHMHFFQYREQSRERCWLLRRPFYTIPFSECKSMREKIALLRLMDSVFKPAIVMLLVIRGLLLDPAIRDARLNVYFLDSNTRV
jgi:hypothetical protein